MADFLLDLDRRPDRSRFWERMLGAGLMLCLLVTVAGCERAVRAATKGDPFVLLEDPPDRAKLLATEPVPFRVFDPKTGGEMWRDTFKRRLLRDDYDLLILGEIHDNPDHHALQLWIIRMLNQLRPLSGYQPTYLMGGVRGLAFEMIPESAEAEINALRYWRPGLPRPGKAEAATAKMADALNWRDSGWPEWSFYAPLLLATPQAYIAGGEISRGRSRDLLKDGLAATSLAPRFELDRPLSRAEQERRVALQISAHCGAISPIVARRMVDTQRLRDAALAAALIRAEDEGEGFAVLITGNGHGRKDWGAPRMLRRATPDKRVLSIALIEADGPLSTAVLGAQFESGRAPFDYVVVTSAQAVDRDDPCAAFR